MPMKSLGAGADNLVLTPAGSAAVVTREFHREIGRSGVLRAQIWGFALPPVSSHFSLRAEGAANNRNSHDSRSSDLPVNSRSRKVAKDRHRSFCELGRGSAAPLSRLLNRYK